MFDDMQFVDKLKYKTDDGHSDVLAENLSEFTKGKFINIQLTMDNIDIYYVRKSIVKAIDENLSNFKGIFLDLGCGEMPYKKYIMDNSGITEYIGVDIENPAYQANVKPDIFWNGEAIPLDDDSVDTVMATELFEHIPDLKSILEEIKRVLRPGGICFFTSPFLWPLHDVPYDECRYTPYRLNRLFENAGFKEIHLKPLGGWNASFAQMIGLWFKRSNASKAYKESLLEPLLSIYNSLIQMDVVPDNFEEGDMITGITGLACKHVKDAANQNLKLSQVKDDDNILAIFTPYLGALSETFIKRHTQLLAPGKTVIVTENVQDNSYNLPVLQIPWSEGPSKYSPQLENIVCEFLSRHKVSQILVEYGCKGTDIIELNARRLHLPIYVHFHGYDASQMLRRKDIINYYKWMSQNVSGIITCAHAMADKLISTGMNKESFIVNYYGVEIPNEISNHVDDETCKFIFVGRLVPKKAPLHLVKAFLKVYQKTKNVTLDIIGNEGLIDGKSPIFDQIKNFINENNLHNIIKLHGAQNPDYVKNILKQSSVYVQHSITEPETGDSEGLPNSILEAASYGLPVISTKHAGIPEEVEDGITGLLVEENDIDGMAEKMLELTFDKEKRKKMGNAAREKIKKQFSVEISINNLRKIIFSKQISKVSIKSSPDYTKNNSSVSVIIPAYNREKFLMKAISSVLNQTYKVNEIIVVDDASTDGTEKLIRDLQKDYIQIKYFKLNRNHDAQYARNTGIINATSDWIGFLDSDDEWLENRVELALRKAFEKNVKITHCDCYRKDNNNPPVRMNIAPIEGNIFAKILEHPSSTFPGLFLRKECFEKIGLLDDSIVAWQEWDTFIRLSKDYDFAFVNEPLFIWNWHEAETISKNPLKDAKGYYQIVKKHKNDIIRYAGLQALVKHYYSLAEKFVRLEMKEELLEIKKTLEDLKNKMALEVSY